MGEIIRRDRGHLQHGEPRPKNALDFLPADVQEQARFFFGFYSETLRGTYGIATRIRFWMKSEGLTAEEAREAMRRLMTPERSAEIDTAPKAIAALSAEVGGILRDRKAREAREARLRRAEIADDADLRIRPPSMKAPTEQAPLAVLDFKHVDDRLPPPGTVITRKYKGEVLQVRVRPDGFEYEGQVYASLSAVAKLVTGTHCNGFAFFNLAKRGDA